MTTPDGTDTPRTDAAAALVSYAVVGEQYEVVTAEFARQLERELAQTAKELADLREYHEGYVAEAKESMAESAKELAECREALRVTRPLLDDGMWQSGDRREDVRDSKEIIDRVLDAKESPPQ